MPEEPEDEGATGLPPHPLDRVWFHPSELGVAPATAGASAPRREWSIAIAGAVCGIVLTVAALAATGALESGDAGSGSASGLTPVFARLQSDRAAELVADATPSIVAVRAQSVGESTGSGVVLGGDRIVTSAALVAGATAVSVTTSRGRVLPASVIGVDPETDLAVLDVKGSDLPAAQLGSADGLSVGSWVLALGAAGGERRWASQGVVSELGVIVVRADGTTMSGLLTTDVERSDRAGGALLIDDDGAVVGVLSRAAPGHAVPVEMVREVAEQLATSGRVRHASLGIEAVDAAERGGGGALVQAVTAGGPADGAGVKVGDVITGFGDQRVADVADLLAALAHRRPGDPVDLAVWRSDKRVERTATLVERP
jgi:S1-C subfamily serine protease